MTSGSRLTSEEPEKRTVDGEEARSARARPQTWLASGGRGNCYRCNGDGDCDRAVVFSSQCDRHDYGAVLVFEHELFDNALVYGAKHDLGAGYNLAGDDLVDPVVDHAARDYDDRVLDHDLIDRVGRYDH